MALGLILSVHASVRRLSEAERARSFCSRFGRALVAFLANRGTLESLRCHIHPALNLYH